MNIRRQASNIENSRIRDNGVTIAQLFDIKTLDLYCRYTISENQNIRLSSLALVQNLFSKVDESAYGKDQERVVRIQFIKRGLEARVDKHLKEKEMIVQYINGGLLNDQLLDISSFEEISDEELAYINDQSCIISEYYFIDKEFEDIHRLASELQSTTGINRTNIINEIKDELSPSVKIVDSYIHIDSCSASGRIDRVYDELDYIEFARTYEITAYVEFTGDYSSLGEAQITFNYTVKFKYDFTWYGARFTQEADYMNPGNSQTLPVSVIVADTATSDDYKLTFTSSDENIATVDTDGIITAENSSDTTAVITVTLEYRGVTYTDTINITVTDLEVE